MQIDWTKYNELFPDRYIKPSNIDMKIEEILSEFKDKIKVLDIGGNEGTEALKKVEEAYLLDPFVTKPDWYKEQITWEDAFEEKYKFNLIIAKNSLNYLDRNQIALLPKLLLPGGVFIANTFNKPSEINREFTNSKSGKKGTERSEYRDGKIFHYLEVDGITIEHSFFYYTSEDYIEMLDMFSSDVFKLTSFTSFQDAPNSLIIKLKKI